VQLGACRTLATSWPEHLTANKSWAFFCNKREHYATSHQGSSCSFGNHHLYMPNPQVNLDCMKPDQPDHTDTARLRRVHSTFSCCMHPLQHYRQQHAHKNATAALVHNLFQATFRCADAVDGLHTVAGPDVFLHIFLHSNGSDNASDVDLSWQSTLRSQNLRQLPNPRTAALQASTTQRATSMPQHAVLCCDLLSGPAENVMILAMWVFWVAMLYYSQQSISDAKPFDPFEILGVTHDASEREIKKAYFKLSLQFHPDKVGVGGGGGG